MVLCQGENFVYLDFSSASLQQRAVRAGSVRKSGSRSEALGFYLSCLSCSYAAWFSKYTIGTVRTLKPGFFVRYKSLLVL